MAAMKLNVSNSALATIACMLLSGCAATGVVADNFANLARGNPEGCAAPAGHTLEYDAWQNRRAEEATAIKSKYFSSKLYALADGPDFLSKWFSHHPKFICLSRLCLPTRQISWGLSSAVRYDLPSVGMQLVALFWSAVARC